MDGHLPFPFFLYPDPVLFPIQQETTISNLLGILVLVIFCLRMIIQSLPKPIAMQIMYRYNLQYS